MLFKIIQKHFYIIKARDRRYFMKQFSIKHRPRKFEELFGQDFIKKDLIKRAATKNFPRAMLLRGLHGTGKTTTAHVIAMTLQCSNPDSEGNPCGVCNSCKSIIEERFDRDTMMLDGSQIGQKDNVVEFTSVINIKPMYDKNRVFIIEEADQLSTGASNALLKVLEAPQDNVYFILLSMVPGGVSPAIQSRCQVFNFKPISIRDMMMALKTILEKEGLWNDPSIPNTFRTQGLAAIATASKGSLREGVQLLEKCVIGEYWTPEVIQEALGIVDEASTYKVLTGLLDFSKDESIWNTVSSADPAELYNYLTLILSDAMICKTTGYVKNEFYADSTRFIASHPNAEKLFTILTEYPQLSKPYVRKADLMAALASYYLKYNNHLVENRASIPIRTIKHT